MVDKHEEHREITPTPPSHDRRKDFVKQAIAKEKRRLLFRRRRNVGILAGFKVFGMVGWTIIGPALLGLALGLWLDSYHPDKGSYLWTLSGLLTGLALGCILAASWAAKEMVSKEDNGDDNNGGGNHGPH